MRLGSEPPGAERLRDYLVPRHERPVALAYSGGGDSHALLISARAWAEAAGRRLVLLHVNHRLQPQSDAWARHCKAVAGRLGHDIRLLGWDGPKPVSGLPAAARLARHRLLADAARAEGAAVILTGHTADDVLESQRMRVEGHSVPDPRAWSPSPVWPEGRGLFLLRPLLHARRAHLRTWLSELGETWIEDPANEDPRYTRARTRAESVSFLEEAPAPDEPPPMDQAAGLATFHDGWLTMDRAGVAALAPREARRLLSIACLCVSGTARPPRSKALERILTLSPEPTVQVATLAGARIILTPETITLSREAGEAGRGGLPSQMLPEGLPVVWDGRYELTATRKHLHVQALQGLGSRLSKTAAAALAAVPAAARAGRPAVVGDGQVICPGLEDAPGVACQWLAPARFMAATGGVRDEAQALHLSAGLT